MPNPMHKLTTSLYYLLLLISLYPILQARDEFVDDLPNIPCSIDDPYVSFSKMKSVPNGLLIINVNIRSIRKNFDNFMDLLASMPVKPCIIVF